MVKIRKEVMEKSVHPSWAGLKDRNTWKNSDCGKLEYQLTI